MQSVMKKTGILILLFICTGAAAQTTIDVSLTLPGGNEALFWAQIPSGYSSANPPAILIWWHQWGGTQHELNNYTDFPEEAEIRGWIAASHFGPHDRHWNAAEAQIHCRAMLDWLSIHYPFSMDSIYMIGGSMGGAAGQVWNNNNCGSDDYLIAATAGASQILDCQLRQEQYLAEGDTNRSMRTIFGGLPSDRDSVAFEYHRSSAVHFADTSQSMHFNSLNLPVWLTWGNSDFERMAYGEPAAVYYDLRTDEGAVTFMFESENDGHGLSLMSPFDVCEWLSGFSVNRYPDFLQINADENGTYFWTTADLAAEDTTFGRYNVKKNLSGRLLDITLIHNVEAVEIDFANHWTHWDSITGYWENLDVSIPLPRISFINIPAVSMVATGEGSPPEFFEIPSGVTVILRENASYHVYFESTSRQPPVSPQRAAPPVIAAYPNPFNSGVTLTLQNVRSTSAQLIVTDILGREITRRMIQPESGSARLYLDGSGWTSGVYFVRLADHRSPVLRVVLMK